MATQVQLRRALSAPAALVWQALTTVDALTQWFWPEESFGTTAEVDLRIGGQFLISGPRAGIAVAGRYTVVEPCERLGLTWQWDGEASESVVAIHLTDTGAGTDLVVTHEGLADEDAREHHAKGWSDCLDRLPGWLDSADRSSS